MPRVPYHFPTATHPAARLWRGIHVDLKAVTGAALIAGSLFLVLELITAFAFGAGTPFGPAQVTLHGLTGREGIPEHLNPGLVLSGVLFHYLLSLLVVLPLAILIHPWREMALCVAVGATMGIALFFLNEAVLAYLLPIWTETRFGFMIADYALFGLTAALTYKWLQRREVSTATR